VFPSRLDKTASSSQYGRVNSRLPTTRLNQWRWGQYVPRQYFAKYRAFTWPFTLSLRLGFCVVVLNVSILAWLPHPTFCAIQGSSGWQVNGYTVILNREFIKADDSVSMYTHDLTRWRSTRLYFPRILAAEWDWLMWAPRRCRRHIAVVPIFYSRIKFSMLDHVTSVGSPLPRQHEWQPGAE
jgi:hypothetical protein